MQWYWWLLVAVVAVLFIRSRMRKKHRDGLREVFSDAEPMLSSMGFKLDTLHYSLYSSGNAFIAPSHVLFLGVGKLNSGERAGFAIELSPVDGCIGAVRLPVSSAMKGNLVSRQSTLQKRPMMDMLRSLT